MEQEKHSATQMLIALVTSREVEGSRAARILHDEVGQLLSAVGLQLDVLKFDMQGRVPEISARTAEIQEILERAITVVRGLSYELNPAIVERAGLQFAMERLCGKYRGLFRGHLRLLYDPTIRVPLAAGNAIYKITELALENAVTHASATEIEVLARPVAGGTTVEIRDNGRGFDPKILTPKSSGIGLILMAHHGRQAGVQYRLKSATGKGTCIKTHFRAPDK